MANISQTSDSQREQLRRAALSPTNAPTDEQQAFNTYYGRNQLRYLGDPQDPTRVSFPFLRRMRRDHLISMGLHFIMTPIIRASWYFDSDDVRAAALADSILRPIFASTVETILRYLWTGYSPAAINFDVLSNPEWTYLKEGTPTKVWEEGPVGAMIYKKLTPLRAENALPCWDSNGAFNGITYDPRYGGRGAFVIGGQSVPTIDRVHSLWAVHESIAEDFSPFGFPRIAHAAPIFHMFRYIWTLLGRAFENNADPGPVVRYPVEYNQAVDSSGRRSNNVKTAMRIGRRRRSGSTIAMSSEVYTDVQDKPTGVKKWDIEYPKPETNFPDIINFIGQLEAMKLRCVTADTPVDCPQGEVLISQLREGQLIWCYNERLEKFELRPLKKVAPTRLDAELLELTLTTGGRIRATPDHKFMLRDGSWVELKDLEDGDLLMDYHERSSVHAVVECGREDTWDLSVDGPPECHSFVVHNVVLHNSIWLQEQGLITSQGSSGGRNAAAEFGQQRDASQAVLMQQVVDLIMDVLVRPVMAMNMPSFSGRLELKTLGFGQDDENIVAQIFQLMGQRPDGFARFGIDVRRLAESRGFPMMDPVEQQKWIKKDVELMEKTGTPEVTPTEGRRALVTQTGFDRETRQPIMSYVQLGGQIELQEDGDFVASLPRTDAFADQKVTAAARSLRTKAAGFLSWLHADFAVFMGKQKTLDLVAEVESSSAEQVAVDVVSRWRPSALKLEQYAVDIREIVGRVFDRVAGVELARLDTEARRPGSFDKGPSEWLDSYASDMVSYTLNGAILEIGSIVEQGAASGLKASAVASLVREHLEGVPQARGAALATSGCAVTYNYAIADVGDLAGVKLAQVIGGDHRGYIGSPHEVLSLATPASSCVRLLPLAPGGLEQRIEHLDGGVMARYDQDTSTILLSPDISDQDRSIYLMSLGDRFSSQG